MKKQLLILILAAFALPACAELTTADTVNPDYLKNHGYSPAIIQVTQKSKAQVNGEMLSEPVEKEYYNLPVIKQVRRFWEYIDPSLDDHSYLNDHKIHTAPHFEDL